MNDEGLTATLVGAFSALSVLLVFVTVLYSLRYQSVLDALDAEIPKDKPKAAGGLSKRLYETMIFHWGPVAFLIAICFYVTTPLAIQIIGTSSFNPVSFDFLQTAFVLVWVVVGLFTFSSWRIMYKLFLRYQECKTYSA